MFSKVTPFALILLTSIIISLPLTVSGLFRIHDDQQVARLYLFDKSLKEGQFPVRWVDELGFGYGYPLFNFYPPLVYLSGEVFHLIGFSFIDSVKLVFFFSIFLSGVGMYVLVKEMWGKFAGLTAALFYTFLPYRALDIYVRGALAESFSFVWLPLILWSFYKLSNLQEQSDYKLSNLQEQSDYKLSRLKSANYILLSAAFLALLMITHNLIFLPFMLILPVYLIFLFLKTSEKKLFVVNCLLSIILALGLAAFFWLPAIFEKKFTLVDQLLLTNLADFRIHFVYLQQLWNWTWGFGGSAAGLADGISFKIGKLHILASVTTFVLATALLKKKRGFPKLLTFDFRLSIIVFVLFIFSSFMTTSYSKIIWELFPPLFYLQFPWRFLIFTGLFSSVLAGALIYLLRVTIFRLLAFIILIILLLLPNLKLFKPQNYRLDLTDEKATSYDVIAWDVSKTSFEYIPNGILLLRDELGHPTADLNQSEILKEKIEVNPATAKISNLEYSSTKIDFELEALENTSVRANIFYFPGWEVKVDRKSVSIDNNNRLKLITFDVSPGVHEIMVSFSNTQVRNFANFVTLISLVFLIYYFVRLWQIRKKS
ncbi:MAG: hypothetical protein UU34_C0022G0005 [Candidatus Curtissbacteria bacterium GW2011_GWA1_41_11]|uniref:Membrane protein 6-pyruvoyl-tetrahydropterin synthase-related domain-containing protein n=1 Tax=Candidatus Curtissbacteria bacterium GW2011_GWA1_41_11 TaxID=1618409 RepID=A0A0G0WNQ5_9BACT|nr:MAG: hypothetical protein UU34_C0022G0005 [Candidatus Curtissbacteria bacterium GW2011_GWA1_41_11]